MRTAMLLGSADLLVGIQARSLPPSFSAGAPYALPSTTSGNASPSSRPVSKLRIPMVNLAGALTMLKGNRRGLLPRFCVKILVPTQVPEDTLDSLEHEHRAADRGCRGSKEQYARTKHRATHGSRSWERLP